MEEVCSFETTFRIHGSSPRNPNLAPKVVNAGQRPQIGPRNVHHTQRHVPSRPYEQCATSLRGPCQIPWATPR
jgi:hypothetical protein